MANKYLDASGLSHLWSKITNAFVAKETGKGLSSNDYTTAEKTKLAGVEAEANKTTIVNNLTSESSTDALSALQGKMLKDEIEEMSDGLDSKVDTSEKGQPNGVPTLDGTGKIPSTQLPSYVDDVLEGYYYEGAFYEEAAHENLLAGETGKIYIDLSTNNSYRYSGTVFTQITSSDMAAITNNEIDTIIAGV